MKRNWFIGIIWFRNQYQELNKLIKFVSSSKFHVIDYLLWCMIDSSLVSLIIVQVLYGSAIVDATSLNVLSSLVDHWMHTGGPKREIGRYHIPQSFFVPFTKMSALVQAVESASPPLVLTAELCGLYFSPIVR